MGVIWTIIFAVGTGWCGQRAQLLDDGVVFCLNFSCFPHIGLEGNKISLDLTDIRNGLGVPQSSHHRWNVLHTFLYLVSVHFFDFMSFDKGPYAGFPRVQMTFQATAEIISKSGNRVVDHIFLHFLELVLG